MTNKNLDYYLGLPYKYTIYPLKKADTSLKLAHVLHGLGVSCFTAKEYDLKTCKDISASRVMTMIKRNEKHASYRTQGYKLITTIDELFG
ncbi:MAG TPA: hypothetical protein VFC41_02415 [Anaerovoracaceae bacterium]|nr:hypothetical protein [Anaerovoracaceae bacterium]